MICPNCNAEAPGGLYEAPAGGKRVTHCGCYYEADRAKVLHHVDDEPEPPACERANGDSLCTQCSKDYYSHPMAPEHLSFDGTPFLHRLCDGRLVKL